MAVRPIVLWPEPWLNKQSAAVLPEEFGSEPLVELADDLVETMHAAKGIGLAAPQLGVHKRVVAVPDPTRRAPHGTLVLCNPVLSELAAEKEKAPEGCLSLPGVELWMERSTSVKVTARLVDGTDYEGVWNAIPARALQHECDHLDGKTIADGVGPLRKQMLQKKLKKVMKDLERAREREQEARRALIRKARGPQDPSEYVVSKPETKASP